MTTTNWTDLHGEYFNDLSVLVTGGAGFIGSHIASALAQIGAKVTCLDDLSSGNPANLTANNIPPINLVQGSVTNANLVNQLAADATFIFHQAALVSVPESIDNPQAYHDVNVNGTVNILEAARQTITQRVMFAASAAAYGQAEIQPQHESHLPQPLSPYAANKLESELLMQAYARCYNIDTASLRYFNIFGPRQSANSAYAAVIAAFADLYANDKAPTIYGDGEQTRDFTYIDNVVHANLLAARCPTPLAGQPINIATARAISVNELAQQMARLIGKPHLQARHCPDRAGDIKHSRADITRAKQNLDYDPIVDFETGLKQTVEWYQSL